MFTTSNPCSKCHLPTTVTWSCDMKLVDSSAEKSDRLFVNAMLRSRNLESCFGPSPMDKDNYIEYLAGNNYHKFAAILHQMSVYLWLTELKVEMDDFILRMFSILITRLQICWNLCWMHIALQIAEMFRLFAAILNALFNITSISKVKLEFLGTIFNIWGKNCPIINC